jgi:hypothetical protein
MLTVVAPGGWRLACCCSVSWGGPSGTQLAVRVELWLYGEQPIQFYLTLDGDLLDDYASVVAVAYNSGDRVTTTREALAHGAEVIEIDVVSVSGILYAAHATLPRFVTRHVYQGSLLASVWMAAADARAIKLDLKETSPRSINLVVRFLAMHHVTRPDQPMLVATRDRHTLVALHARAPAAIRLLSIGEPAQFEALTRDAALVNLINCVTIKQTLLTEERMMWLKDNDLVTLAWTVNDLERMNELVAPGVDGIMTDNLAIMELLVGQSDDATDWMPSSSDAVTIPGQAGDPPP